MPKIELPEGIIRYQDFGLNQYFAKAENVLPPNYEQMQKEAEEQYLKWKANWENRDIAPEIKPIQMKRGRELRNNYPIIDSVGLEVETETIIQGNMPMHLRVNWHEDHDASIESYAYMKHGLMFKERLPNSRKMKLGSEIVSNVLDSTSEQTDIAIKQLLNWVQENGETEESFRAGIHVHVCMPQKLNIQKNLINLTAYLEQVFFYVGGMGYQHRGMLNNFTYCRPITKYGPSCVKYDRYAAQCFTTQSLLESKNNNEFWDRYGGIDPNNPPHKYIPQRYTWFTLYPLLTKGTVEFRIFNKSLNYYYIKAAINLCKAVCDLALKGDFNFPENSIYDKHTKENVFRVLGEFSGIAGLDSGTYNTLVKMINRTSDIVVEPEYYWTHLMYTKFNKLESLTWRGFEPIKIKRDLIKTPKFVDIHNLEDGENNKGVPDFPNPVINFNPFVEQIVEEKAEEEEMRELIFDEDEN